MSFSMFVYPENCKEILDELQQMLRKENAMARSSKLESGFQDNLIKKIKQLFPECLVFKMEQRQGIPDLLILNKNKWAALECKKNINASKRPNQDYYVSLMNTMSFSRFIYPENCKEVLDELQQTFRT